MKKDVKVQNLKCGGCAHTISDSLNKIPGVQVTSVDVESGNVTLELESESDESMQAIANNLRSLGYPLEGDDNSIVSKAKSYVSCAIGKIN